MLKNPHAVPLAAALTVALAALPATGSTTRPELRGALDEYLSRLEGLGFAGVALVADDGEIVLAEGYGLADRDRGIPWTTGTVSSVGSITKQFTGAAIMKLVSDGKLATDDPITRFFEDVPEDKRGITVHHLLTHTAGLTDVLGGDFELVERDELVSRAMAEPLVGPPGDEYRYSNLGYSLLGAIVENVSDRGYEEFLRAELLAPAGAFELGSDVATRIAFPGGDRLVVRGEDGDVAARRVGRDGDGER